MSTREDLKGNPKSVLIRRITKGKTWSINIAQSHIEKAKLSNSEYLYSWVDTKNRLVFEAVKVENEG